MNIDEATKYTIKFYQKYLRDLGYFPTDHSENFDLNLSKKDQLSHCLWMCEKLLSNETSHYSLDKVSRWLGFIQYGLIINGITTVEKERNRTRPWLTGAK